MVRVERGHHLLLQDAAWVIVDAGAALLQDHVALGRYVLRGQAQIGHAVGLHAHDRGQAVLRDALEVGGHVVIGEGVIVAAVLGDDLGELAGRDLLRALEHQMLEEMRDAGRAGRFVGGADLVPDHLGDDGRAAIRDHDHMEAVFQGELAHLLGGFDMFDGDGCGHKSKTHANIEETQSKTTCGVRLIAHPHHHNSGPKAKSRR